ncbi:42367_t:CDS:1, partial [Gigaspora margarita]
MTRRDKKDTTCERCGRELSTPQRLCTHLERDNPYRPRISPVHIPQNQKLLSKQNFNYSVTASDKLLPKNANNRLS